MPYTYEKKLIKSLAEEIKSAGYRVFIAKSETYGFFTDKEGSRVVSIGVDYLAPKFSGNYNSEYGSGCGNGWRINHEGLTFDQIFSSNPPRWGTKGKPVVLDTLETYQKKYQSSSKFKEVF